MLRTPDLESVPFPEVLSRYDHAGPGWVQLLPRMRLVVENGYYRDGGRDSLPENFLGTEIARYQVRPRRGLRLLSVHSRLAQRPGGQPPVQELIPPSQRRLRYHRLFFQVGFKQEGNTNNAVLLGAESLADLDRLTKEMASVPDSACGSGSGNCVLFPKFCTVSLEFELKVNGSARSVVWGTDLRDLAKGANDVAVFRLHDGRLTPVELDSNDAGALRLPLLPGDRIVLAR